MGTGRRYAVSLALSGTLVGALVPGASTPVRVPTSCTNLSSVKLPGGAVNSAKEMTAPFTTAVQTNAAPTADSQIHVEVWLPRLSGGTRSS